MPELRRSKRVSLAPVPESKKPKSEAEKVGKVKNVAEPKKKATSKELLEGDEIPDLTLLDENENEVSLRDAAKKRKYLVIFAYPKASTPGCTRQVCGFQKNYQKLTELDTTVFGLSADKPKSQLNFVTKQKLEYPLLSDPTSELIGLLGAKKSPSGIKRSHWIFVDGVLKIKKIQISPEVSVNSALEDIEKLREDGEDVKDEKDEKEEEKEGSKEEENKDETEEKNDTKEEEKKEEVKEEAKADNGVEENENGENENGENGEKGADA
ncbi:CIC11C00000005601 [Sungouiella intermedia]|uniref:thioredoxin-dependent peroxiredoxin n=1 Tax=Sungouiella intermedia TaxID=45354 RepID=A0A1L0DKU0_9ASCO|nr:CIC11C00000005601 [[Candida] intermedia]